MEIKEETVYLSNINKMEIKQENAMSNIKCKIEPDWENYEDTPDLIKCELKGENPDEDYSTTNVDDSGDSKIFLSQIKSEISLDDLKPEPTLKDEMLDYTEETQKSEHGFLNADIQNDSCGLLNNEDIQHSNQNLSVGTSYGCDICCKQFSDPRLLRNHMKYHNGENDFQCKLCFKRFVSNSHLQVHTRSHTGERPYRCEICTKGFHHKSALKIHMRLHTGERPFQCKLCSKKFLQACHLKNHIRMHTGEKPYSCHICSKQFSQATNLNSHMLFHSGEKTLSCKFCSKQFSLASHLDTHMRSHTGEKP
uniref:Zinc finger protein 37-like isoform X2 n=1 Tax=Diabrotica virgifera virgifera TaxID=50390 RepID=A0A6P7FUB4_DIAVI